MTEAITASPLYWPRWVDRTKTPIRSRFGKWQKPVTIARATDEVLHQLGLMGAANEVISTDLRLRLDGLPYSNQRTPDDPGAAVWFLRGSDQTCIAIDQYDRIGCNLWAIAKTIEAMRGIERWGGNTILGQAFKGFTALPGPSGLTGWRGVFGYEGSDLAEVGRRYKLAMSRAHPDRGGTNEQAARYNQAWSEAKRELA